MSRNNFFNERVKGLHKEISLQDAVAIACGGGRIFFSKRLAPPLCICNARVYCGNDFLFSSDINIKDSARALEYVAHIYGVTLDILYENGDSVIWSTATPEMIYIGGETYDSLESAYNATKPHRDQMARQWAIDHGLARRTPKEWFRDICNNLRWRWYDAKYTAKKFLERHKK